MEKPKYRRVLLKISGEALAGDKHFGLDFSVIGQVTDVIKIVGEGINDLKPFDAKEFTADLF